jgi:iron complex transport system ATP-binding protein
VTSPTSPSAASSPRTTAEGSPVAGASRSTPFPLAGEVVLDVDHVTAGYGEAPVLRDVSFAVRRGEVVALLGPNGCGKTTLLRIVGKLLPATSGSVRVTGREVAAMSQLELSRTLATVAQVQRTTFPFSVLDILLTGRLPYVSVFASPRESDVRICRDVLDRFGIRHLEQTPITRLSGGERQLVMIARALAQEPRVLLLDEPTTYLDLRNQVQVLETIAGLARSQELSVLMTIHDPNQALAYADGCVLLRKLAALEGIDPATAVGPAVAHRTSTVASGDPGTVLSPEHVQEAYGMAVDLVEHGRRRLIVPLE